MALVSKGGCDRWRPSVGCRGLEKRPGAPGCGDTTSQGISRSRVRQGRVPERLGGTSGARLAGFLPQLIGLDEGVEDREQLSHGCGQGELLGFPLAQ